jgi:hypothetical protein
MECPLIQNDELTRVKLRITALTARTIDRGCTEAEAMAAAAMVGRLLERYALTMEEVDIRQQPCIQITIPIGGKRRRPIDICVPAIARFCDCKVWFTRSELQAHYVFFGFDTETQLAGYVFHIIAHAMHSEVADFRARSVRRRSTLPRQAATSFQNGLAARVAERLEAMHAEREAAVAAQRPTGNALTIVRHQVVEDAFQAANVQLRTQRGLSTRPDAAFRAGKAAGERINLNRPVGHGVPALLD